MMRWAFVMAVVLGFAGLAFGGWVQVDNEGSTTLISEGMLKEVGREEEQYSILDARKGNIIFVDSGRKLYAMDSIDGFCSAVIAEVNKMRGTGEATKQKSGKAAPKVSVVNAGDSGKVAGYGTVRYEVKADGRLYEEVWLTTDATVMNDLGSVYKSVMKKFEKCLSSLAMVAESLPLSVEESSEYKKLEEAGWQLKSKSYSGSRPLIFEVVKLEKRDIPAAEFAVPKGYKKVPLSEILFRED